jgi:hypothetical protein
MRRLTAGLTRRSSTGGARSGRRPVVARSWRRARRPTTGLTRRPSTGDARAEADEETDGGLDEEAVDRRRAHAEAVDRRSAHVEEANR